MAHWSLGQQPQLTQRQPLACQEWTWRLLSGLSSVQRLLTFWKIHEVDSKEVKSSCNNSNHCSFWWLIPNDSRFTSWSHQPWPKPRILLCEASTVWRWDHCPHSRAKQITQEKWQRCKVVVLVVASSVAKCESKHHCHAMTFYTFYIYIYSPLKGLIQGCLIPHPQQLHHWHANISFSSVSP